MMSEIEAQREHIAHLEEIFALFAPADLPGSGAPSSSAFSQDNDSNAHVRSDNEGLNSSGKPDREAERSDRARRLAYVREQLAKKGAWLLSVKGYTEDDLLILIAVALVTSFVSFATAMIACCMLCSSSGSHVSAYQYSHSLPNIGTSPTPRKKYPSNGNLHVNQGQNVQSALQNGSNGTIGNVNSHHYNTYNNAGGLY
jgi:hypothetical protein